MATPALQHQRYYDWTPSPEMRIYTRSPYKPRDESPRFAKGLPHARPAPIILAPGQVSPLLRQSGLANGWTGDKRKNGLVIPEVVDIADSNTWPRRGQNNQHVVSRATSRCSTRQSQLSYGVLDYYMQDLSPLTSPKYLLPPKIETPVLGPAIDQFDFGLKNLSATLSDPLDNPPSSCGQQDTIAGAAPQQNQNQTNAHQAIKSLRPKQETKRSYRLFPTVQEPSSSPPQTQEPPNPPTSNPPSHIHPPPSHRPRRESITGSIRSRKDSLTSFTGTRRIPLRILSNTSKGSVPVTRTAGTTATTSPPQSHSSSTAIPRWSDETITSPLVATTPGPHTSFGSLLRGTRTSAQYPACFFEDDEDDDEAAPLTRKLTWRPPRSKGTRDCTASRGSTGSRLWSGRFDERRGWGRKVRGWVLCGCGG